MFQRLIDSAAGEEKVDFGMFYQTSLVLASGKHYTKLTNTLVAKKSFHIPMDLQSSFFNLEVDFNDSYLKVIQP